MTMDAENALVQLIIDHLSGTADPTVTMEDVAHSLGVSRATLYRKYELHLRAIRMASTAWAGYADAMSAKRAKEAAEVKAAHAERQVDALTAQLVVLTLRNAYSINQPPSDHLSADARPPISLDVERAVRRSDDPS